MSAAKRRTIWLLFVLLAFFASSASASIPKPDTLLQQANAVDRAELFDSADVEAPPQHLIDRASFAWLDEVSHVSIDSQDEIRISEVAPFDEISPRSLFSVKQNLASGLASCADETNVSCISELGLETWWGVDFHAYPFVEPANGLVYARARWYDPSTGTFVTPDPMGYTDSSNMYAFAGGDPINNRDPRGEAASVAKNGTIIGARPDGTRYRIAPGSDPVVALRVLESDSELSSAADQENVLIRAGLPIPTSSACRAGESCIGSRIKSDRAYTHLPRDGNWVKNALIATSGLPAQNREQQLVQGGLQIAATATMVMGGTYGNAGAVSAAPVTVLSTPSGFSAPIPLTLAVERGWVPKPKSEGRWAPAEEGGRTVYWADDIFASATRSSWQDPSTGRWKRGTNVERMADGLAPIGNDGKSVNLHHLLQEEPGALAEVPASLHSKLPHKLLSGESFRRDPVLKRQFDNFRRDYWKQRSKDFK